MGSRSLGWRGRVPHGNARDLAEGRSHCCRARTPGRRQNPSDDNDWDDALGASLIGIRRGPDDALVRWWRSHDGERRVGEHGESGTVRLLFCTFGNIAAFRPARKPSNTASCRTGREPSTSPAKKIGGIAALKRCVVDLGNAMVIKWNAGRGEIQIAKRGRSTGRDENAFKRFSA